MQEGFHLKRMKRKVTDVHGGRVVPSMGRKDRHSKVCTTTGTKERRVRLSPNTAIQFYDLQDRLGYDRPSKALDWLMKAAKSSIDTLDHSDIHSTENFMQSGDHQAYEGFQDHSQRQSLHCSSQYLPDDSIIISGHEQGLFSASPPSHLDSDMELAAIPRLFSWNHDSVHSASGQFFSQREPLQSSICPSTRFCCVGSGNEISRFTAEPREVEEKENNSIFMKPSSAILEL